MKTRLVSTARLSLPIATALAAILSGRSAHAQIYWDGATNTWTTAAAWSTAAGAATPNPASAPTTANATVFNITTANTASSDVSMANGARGTSGMTINTSGTTNFRAGGASSSASTFTIGAGGITMNAGTVVIGQTPTSYGNITVALGANQVWTNDSTGLLTVVGPVTGASRQLTKSGTGQIRLNGANTYSGATIVNGGDLLIGSYSGLSNTSAITVSGGTASLQLVQVGTGSTSNTINKPLSLHGALRTAGGSGSNILNQSWDGNITLAGAGTIWNNGNSTFDINGQVDLGANTLTFQTDRDGSRIDGNIIGTGGSLIKTGSLRNLTLTGANTFTGDITVSAGTLIGAGATNSPGVTVFGARDNTRTITVSSGATLQFNSGNILGANHSATTAPTLVVNGGTVTNGGTASNNALNNVQLNGGTLTSTTGHTSSSSPFDPVYGAWNINGTVTSSGTSTISTSDPTKGWIMLKVVDDKTTNFDVTSGTLTVSAPVVDNPTDGNIGSLTKSGAGTMILSGANTYSGTTSVGGGTLAISGTGDVNSSSGITVNGTNVKLLQTSATAITPTVTLTQGTLTGSGTVNTVNVGDATGGVISNNNGVAGASLTIGALTFDGAATVNTFGNGSAPIVTTSLATNGAGLVTINPTAAVWSAGTYDLISYGGGSIGGAGFAQFSLGTMTGASPRQSKTLGDSGTAITLTVGTDDVPYWAGDGDGKWNLASTNNWKLSSDNSYTTFLAGDNVLFNDSATGAGPVSVDIDLADVATTTTTFNNPTKDYVLGGAFGISSGSLTKSGAGALTITNANTYTGNTTISDGVLDISTDGAQLYSSATPVAAVVTVTNGGVLVVKNYGQASTTGLGSTSLGNLNNTGGQVVLDGGTLRFNNETAERGRKTNIGAGGGTLEVVNNSALILNSTGTFIFSGANTLTLTGDATSTGTIQGVISGTGVSLVKNGAATWTLSGNNTYTGDTTISSGILAMSTNRIPNSPMISIAGGATLAHSATANANFVLTAGQSIVGTGTGTATFNTGNNAANGVQISGNTTISHTGSGTLKFQRLDIRGSNVEMTGGNIETGVAGSRRGLLVGNNAAGSFTLSGGTLTSVGGNSQPDAIGANNVSGTFTLSGGNYINPGILSFGVGSTTHPGGTLNIDSGGATIGTLLYNASAAGGEGIVNLNTGGSLTVGAITSTAGQTKEFNFAGGQFIASGNVAFPADVTANVKDGGAIIDTNGFSATINSPMVNFLGTSTGGLTKSGLGTLTLSGANTYAGGTAVNAGALRFSTVAASATDVTVAGGAEAGALVAADDAQWINTGDLILQNNGTALVDYGSTTPTTDASFAPVKVADFTFGTTPGVKVAGAAVPSLAVGQTYPLVTWTGTGPVDGSAFTLRTHRLSGTFSVVSDTLLLTVTDNAAGLPISWNTGDGNWDTITSNWADGDVPSSATTYFDTLDSVLFGGATGNVVVTLDDPVSPLGTTMDSSGRNYTITGAGSIGGSGGLSLPVTNTGTLTLSTTGNTFSGGTSVLGGTLALGHATDTLPDAGSVVVDGASATLGLGANNDTVGAVSLKNGASITGTGTLTGSSYAFESGSVSVGLAGSSGVAKTTADTVTLSGNNSYTGPTTVSDGTLILSGATTTTGATTVSTGATLVLGNTGALQSISGMTLAIGSTLRLATDTAFTTLPSFGGSSALSPTPTTFISDRATLGAGLVHSLGTPNLGANTFNFIQGSNVDSGTAGFTLGGIGLTAGSGGTTMLNPTDATVSVTGQVSISANSNPKTLELSGTNTGNEISGDIITNLNTLSLAKSGTSTWTLSGANTYNGATTIDAGTLVFSTNNKSHTGGLVFGATAGGTNFGNLEMPSASATFGGGLVVQTNSATANAITVGSGQTLTFTGSSLTNAVTIGNNASAVLANLQVSGDGALTVNEETRNFVVASSTGGSSSANLDLSGLAAFNATLANLYVGRPTSAAGAAADGRPADSMVLAASNNITASGDIVVGAQGNTGFQGDNFLTLGTANTINANRIVVGNGRARGTMAFDTGLTNPSVTLRGATGGSSRVNITLGDQLNGTSVGNAGGGSNLTTGTMNFTGGTVDALIGTLTLGNGGTATGGNRGRGVGTFTFGDGSSVDVNSVVIGQSGNNGTASTSQPLALAGNGTLNVNGGTLVVNTAITIANDNDTSDTANGVQNVTGIFNQSGGTATIGSLSTPVSVIMGTHLPGGNSGVATATMTLTGGTTNVFGDIKEGLIGAGSIASTLTLDGGTLDMQGNSIGLNILLIDTLNFRSGTLKNVASINDTAGLVKTTAGTLTLDGTMGYTGATTITDGTLSLAATTSIATSSAVDIAAAGTLDTSAQATYAVPAAQPLSITIDPAGAGSSGKITAAGLNINDAVVTLNTLGTLNDPVYVLATYTSLTGASFAAPLPTVPSGYTLQYAYEGNKIALVQTSTPYTAWAAAKGLDGTAGKENGKADDPDKDGKNNLFEFAFDGDPLSGVNDGKIVGKVVTLGGNQVLTLTLPVRAGATFNPDSGDQLSDATDSVVYRIEGDKSLNPFADAITEVIGGDATTIQDDLDLPDLTLGGGWTYRTFRAPDNTATEPKAFLRAKVTSDTP